MLSATVIRIPPGYVGIKVNNLGTHRGVQDIALRTGLVFYTPVTSTVFEYPTFVQTAVWTAARGSCSPRTSPSPIVSKKRACRNELAARYTAEEVYGTKREQLLGQVKERINSEVSSFGVRIEQLGFIGAPRARAAKVGRALTNGGGAIQRPTAC